MDVKITGNKMVITVDLADRKTAPLSSSGKTKVLYSSGGFKTEGDVRIGLNVIAAR